MTERNRQAPNLGQFTGASDYQQLYDAAPVMLYAFNTAGRIETVNDHWLRSLGYARSEVIGKPLNLFLTAESRRLSEEVNAPEFWRRGWQRDTPYRIRRRNGEVLDVLLSANLVYANDGTLLGGQGALVDVSERRRIEADYRAIFENASEGIYRSSPDGQLLQVNPALAYMHGFGDTVALLAAVSDVGRDWYISPHTRQRLAGRLKAEGRVEGFIAECRRVATGEHFWTSENVRVVRDASGQPLYFEGTVRDITAQRRAEALDHARGEILELIARDHGLTEILYEIVGTVEHQYPRLTAGMFENRDGVLVAMAAPGLAASCIAAIDDHAPSVVGGTLENALHGGKALIGKRNEQRGMLRLAMERCGYDAVMAVPIRDQGNAVQGLLTAFAASAVDATPAVGELLGEMAQMASIALEQSRLVERLMHQARYDPLTDLPNRSLLNDRLQQALSEAERKGTAVAVVLLDLDEFKLVNDTLGHSAGDELLREVADRLRRETRGADTIARLGGDEFVQVARVKDTGGAIEIAERLLDRLQQRLLIAGQEVTAHPSIGIGLYPGDGNTPEALLQCADTAMYAAKSAGKNQYQFFAATMNVQVTHRLRIETELRQALEQGDLELHYQPRVDLADQRLLGAECLLRWPLAGGGFVAPGEFLPIAERSSLISEVDRYVLERVIGQLVVWQRAGHELVVSANLSTRDLHKPGFAREIAELFARHGADPAHFELEITESMLMHDIGYAREQLQALKARAPGIRIAIDDFGSGYSSLNYLRHLPIDTLKIDRSFVHDLAESADDPTAAAIVRTIVEMGRNLHFNVVAEGVERADQARLLSDLGCHEAQGYLFAEALPRDRFAGWLA